MSPSEAKRRRPREIILFGQPEIEERIRAIARELAAQLQSFRRVHFVVIAQGGLTFFEHLKEALVGQPWSKYRLKSKWSRYVVRAQSYQRGKKMFSANVEWATEGPKVDKASDCIVLVDDILDTGDTAKAVLEQLYEFGVPICVVALLHRESCELTPEFKGFTIPDGPYVYGFGMDDDEGRRREKLYIAYEK